jgi:hypothetical protein
MQNGSFLSCLTSSFTYTYLDVLKYFSHSILFMVSWRNMVTRMMHVAHCMAVAPQNESKQHQSLRKLLDEIVEEKDMEVKDTASI